MLFLALFLCITYASALIIPLATSPIVSTITTTRYATTSSVVSQLTTVYIDTSIYCPTGSTASTTVCIAGAAWMTTLPIWETDILTIPSEIPTTVGYSTFYTTIPDTETTSAKQDPSNTIDTGISTSVVTLSDSETQIIIVTSSTGVVRSGPSAVGPLPTASTRQATASPATTGGNLNAGSAQASKESGSGGFLSLAQQIGIGLGVGVGVLCGACAVLIYKRRRERRATEMASLVQRLSDEEKVRQSLIRG